MNRKKTKGKERPAEEPAEIDPGFAPVAKAFANDRQIVCTKGWGAGSTVLKIKGKIFAMTVQGSLVVKLPKERVTELVGGGKGRHFDPRHDGRLMKEWVVIDGAKASWVALAREAHRFVAKKVTGCN